LHVGSGSIDGVPPQVWEYEVSGTLVVKHWFSYRKASRDRPIIGERRTPSVLGEIQPQHWPSEYTTELLNLLNVLGRLVKLESTQADLLERICQGSTISVADLQAAGALMLDERQPMKPTDIERTSQTKQTSLPLPDTRGSRMPQHVKSKAPKKKA
ncbi:MAG TPA: type ISP restriction/modification enzyme, partial [Polyangiales bacterium]|nr:type ISP restriction/modification enzyme [Polyangiales bacterium]